MSQGTKVTSLAKLTAALTEHGWQFEAVEQDVSVPDYDSPKVVRHRYSGRASYVPTKPVPGVVVKAKNGVEGEDYWRKAEFTARFTADGKYLDVTGGYPFNTKGYSLTAALKQVEQKAPGRIAKQEQEQAERKARELAEYDAKVAAAYAEAQEALSLAKGEMVEELVFGSTGLTHEQAEQVLDMMLSGKFGPVLNASTQVERTAQGWVPGENYSPATYKDGKRVEGSEY